MKMSSSPWETGRRSGGIRYEEKGGRRSLVPHSMLRNASLHHQHGRERELRGPYQKWVRLMCGDR